MLNNIIKQKSSEWLNSKDCSTKELISYIRTKGELRDTQIEAIESYLFLKIKCENKPLWKLFSEGFFTNGVDLRDFNVLHPKATNFLLQNTQPKALFDFANLPYKNDVLLPELSKLILEKYNELDYEKIIKEIFYNVNYADYLMSLPMGAGKTYLMAAFILLDLYFAQNEPHNKNFAHNFLILIPSGLKSSIIPSLKTIENFDPTWVLPEPAASKIKQLLKFKILDQPKAANKSTKALNPNAEKVNQCLPNPFGQVFVVNAEKVILNRTYLSEQFELIEKTEDEKDKYANELRNLIGKIPNLQIMIDEVHHAATDDIKLRQVVNKWNDSGTITTVLGFSGTPYLSKTEKIKIEKDTFLKFSQITNTVYYYPLTVAIQKFLKTPKVKVAQNLDKFQIIKNGIENFQKKYGSKIYKKGTIPKLAIYCTNIETLEEEIYPFLIGTLKINPDEILRYHKGNKKYSLPKQNELEFNSLDLPLSKKRYILLVQIGKEGWDCQSLTGIILSQKGDSPKNMVLQTSCRCLRQVDKGKDINETALIWLNEYNANILNTQLKNEQNTSIEELNKLNKEIATETVERHSRIEHLQLPPVEFYQLKVTYSSFEEEKNANTERKLKLLLKNLEQYKTTALIRTSELSEIDDADIDIIEQQGNTSANFNHWLFQISKQSFNLIPITEIENYSSTLKKIFSKITYTENNKTAFNELYDLYKINSQIRLTFSIKRTLKTDDEFIEENAKLLIVDNLNDVEKNDKLFPNKDITEQILKYDKEKNDIDKIEIELKAKYEKAKKYWRNKDLENYPIV